MLTKRNKYIKLILDKTIKYKIGRRYVESL